MREDTPEGSDILSLVANDLDGSSPNNDLLYRITSGAKDKFVVDPETGMCHFFGADFETATTFWVVYDRSTQL